MYDFIITFADHHSFIAFFAILGIINGVFRVICWPFTLVKRVIRSRDIRARGCRRRRNPPQEGRLMQTFLPVADFVRSAKMLDYQRLGKQRVECKQILTALGWHVHGDTLICQPDPYEDFFSPKAKGWSNHPASLMWKGYELALAQYQRAMIMEWIARGYKNTMLIPAAATEPVPMPPWLGRADLHASHRSNLLRKRPDYYAQFMWKELDDLEYVWPSKETPMRIAA